MLLLKTIFYYEWRQLFRQRWMLFCLITFTLISVLAMMAGNSVIKERFIQIDHIRSTYQEDLQSVKDKFSDTISEKGKADARVAGMVAMINYRLPQTVIKEPAPMAALSLGLADVQPWHLQVKNTKNFNDITETPVSNPMVLFSGNFDYAFVLIYLLPLVVFVCCYSVYSSEKDAGTLTLLSVQTGNVQRVIRLKLLFRFIVLAVLITLLNSIGFLLAERRTAHVPVTLFYWMLISWLYLVFWVSICYLVLVFKKTAMVTALQLISCWLLLVIVIPSLVNVYAQVSYPLPMKDEIASYRRLQGEEIWGMSARALSDSFNLHHPQYAATIDPDIDTIRLSDRFVAGYYDLLERRMNRVLEPYQQQLEQRNQMISAWLQWNPVLVSEQLFNELSDHNLKAYHDFFQQTDHFQKEWQGFLYPYHFRKQHLTPEEFSLFPVFEYHRNTEYTSTIFKAGGFILLFSALLLLIALIAEKRSAVTVL